MSEFDRLDQYTGFKPFYDEEATRRLLNAYYQVPHTFDDKLKSQLFDHATFYGMPVEEEKVQKSPADNKFDLMNGIKGMGQGFLSGFSTFQVGEHSNNEYERIMRSVGELAGFVGYVPAAPFKFLKAMRLLNPGTANNLVRAAQQVRGKSVPMVIAKKVTDKVSPAVAQTLGKAADAKNDAFKTAAGFLTKEVPSHVAEGAFHLGIASSVSAWQLGVNEMLKSGMHGAVTGGVFRGIANLVNKGGIPKLDPTTGRQIYTATQQEDRMLRAAASSLYEGLRSTYRGETTPEQIYSYLLGAYFGANETTAGQMRARKVFAEVEKKALVDAKELKRVGKDGKPYYWDAEIYDPERLGPSFTELPKDVKESVYHMITARHGTYSSQARTVDATLEQLKENYDIDIEYNRAQNRVEKEQIAELAPDYEGSLESIKKVTPYQVNKNPEKVFLIEDYNSKGIQGKENVLTIPTDMVDADLSHNRKIIGDIFKEVEPGKAMVLPEGEFAQALKENAPKTYMHLLKKIGQYASGELGAKKEATDSGKIFPPMERGTETEFEMSDVMIRKKAVAFVNTYLPDITTGLSKHMAGVQRKKAEESIYELFEKHTKLSDYENFVSDAQVKFQELGAAPLNRESKLELRNMFVRKTGQKEVLHFTHYMGELKELDTTTDINVQNRAGDSKLQAESPKLLDYLYFQLTGKADAIRKWDHFVINDNGVARSVDMKDVYKPQNYAWMKTEDKPWVSKDDARNIGNAMIGNGLREAAKRGYYYSGGKGDSGSMYFYKYHPTVEKSTTPSADMAKIVKIFGETNPHAFKQYKALKDAFIKDTKGKWRAAEKAEYFDRAILSNLYWDKEAYGIGSETLKHYATKVSKTPKFKMKMVFKDGQTYFGEKYTMRPEFRGKSTMDLIESGDRTATTRYGKGAKELEKYNVGDTFEVYDGERKLLVEVTKKAYDPTKRTAEQWSKLEGWDVADFQRVLRRGAKDGARQIQYKLSEATIEDGFFKWIRDYSSIRDAKGFNKRNQIWLTDGFELDVNYFNNIYLKGGGKGTEDGKARYRIFDDADNKNLTKDDKASLYTESTDGAILVEKDFLDALNKTYGLPDSGQNKSFIVDRDPVHGAVLGKFMFHAASDKASAWMKKEGLHMLMPKSAVKESGSRIAGTLKVNDKMEGEYTRGTSLPNIPLIYKKNIPSSVVPDTFTAARTNYKTREIFLDKDLMKKKFKDKAWTKPRMKGVDPLPKDAFKTYQEFEDFVVAHERAHFTPENQAIPKGAAKENHANQLALLETGTQKYELNLENLRGSLSEKQTHHMLDRQMIPKQLMANLMPHSKNPLNKEHIKDFFDKVIKTNYEGDQVLNDNLADWLSKSPKEFTEARQTEILRDFNKLGLVEVIDALKNKVHHDFVSRLYQKVLKSNTEAMHQDFEAGEITRVEYMDAIADARHYTSNINRMMTVYPDVAVFNHKDVRNYLQAAMRNFVVNQVIRPKWDYSISTRMRGLDPWLAKEFDFMNLNTSGKGSAANKKRLKDEWGVKNADELFMLDNKYRDVRYTLPSDVLPKRKGGDPKYSLGELWDDYMSTPAKRVQTRKENPKLAEWFNTISLRVPMDSISGAHKLTFAGFTGIKGHGAVFHPRTMKALGGADLDGDKAFVMFGMEKEWKDMYHSNKYEYMKDSVKEGSPVTKVISGGQLGIDQLGLKIAKELGLETGGTAPQGFGVKGGKMPELAKEYGLVEVDPTTTKNYSGREKWYGPRTEKNILDADGTLVLASRTNSPGTGLTINLAKKHNKPFLINPDAKQMRAWLRKNNIKTLNIAGNTVPKKDFAPLLREALGKPLKETKNIIADNKQAPISDEGIRIIKENLTDSPHDKIIAKKIQKGGVTYQDLLTTTNDGSAAELALKTSFLGKYAPNSRFEISMGAAEGRDQLGPAVTSKQILNSAYNALVNMPPQRYHSPGKKTLNPLEYIALKEKDPARAKEYTADHAEEIKFNLKDWKTGTENEYTIYIKPRTSKGELAYSRELQRAQIGYGSDPLDELGLTGTADWFNKSWHSLFKIDWNGNEAIKGSFNPNTHARQGLVKTFTGFNQAYFSKNHAAGRRFYAHEILERAMRIEGLTEAQTGTMLPRMVELLRPLDYTDDLLRRVTVKKTDQDTGSIQYVLKDRYNDYDKTTAVDILKLNNSFDSPDGGLFGRFTFKVKYNPEIARAIELKLYRPERRLYYSDAANFPKLFNDPNNKMHHAVLKKGLPLIYEKGKDINELLRLEREAKIFRAEEVDKYYRDHSFFLQSDAMDRASGRQILKAWEIAKKEGMSLELFKNMTTFVESIKRFERNKLKEEANKQVKKRYHIKKGKDGPFIKTVLDIEATEKGFATKEQVDTRIRDFKRNNGWKKKRKKYTINKVTGKKEYPLTPAESYLFDSLMLSSYYKGKNIENLPGYKAAVKSNPELRQFLEPLIKEIYKGGSGTYWHKTALKSKYTSDSAIRDFLREYSTEFREISKEGDTRVKLLDAKEYVEGDMKGESKSKNHEPIDIYEDPLDGIANIRARLDENPNKVLTKPERAMVNELAGHLNYYHNSVGSLQNLNLIARGLRRKNFDTFTLEDFRIMNRFFADLRGGNMWMSEGKLTKNGILKLAKRHWMLFPKTISKEMMVKDFTIFEQDGRFQNYRGEWVAGKVGQPTHIIENIQYVLGNVQDFGTKLEQDEKTLLADLLREKTGYESIPKGMGEYFTEVATAQRDLRAYRSGRGKKFTMQEYHAGLKRELQNLQEAKDNINWNAVKDKKFPVTIGKETHQLTGRQIVKKINDVLTEVAIRKMKWIRGDNWDWDPSTGDYVLNPNKPDPLFEFYRFKGRGKNKEVDYWNGNPFAPKIDMEKFVSNQMKRIKEGKGFDMKIGLDNLRKVTNSFNIETLQRQRRTAPKEVRPDYDAAISALANTKIDYTNYFHPNDYHPHFVHNKNIAKEAVIEAIEKIKSQTSLGGEEQVRRLKSLIHQYKNMTGEWLAQDLIDNEIYDQALMEIELGKKGEAFRDLLSRGTAANMMSRSTNLPGWDRSLGAWDVYNKNLIDTFHRQMGNIISRDMLRKFNEKVNADIQKGGWGDSKQARAWTEFIRDYISRAQGFPSKIPEHWVKGPEAELMNVKGTPYNWFADNHVKDMVNKIRKKLGFKDDTRLPEELRGIDEATIRHWSNLEAKYQMATLLAHPKSAIANIFGGRLHTIQSVGWRNWKNARNISYLKSNIPGMGAWQTMKDVSNWVIGHGVIPDFILYEAGLNPNFKGGKWKQFLEDAKKLIDKDPMVKDETLRSLAKKHKITDVMFNKAAWFMREPERHLRQDAFVAHYLQARELFGHANMPLDHPLLIEMAKKGVKATQFLYSAPYRPAFSATALGKVMTRFQTWAWNSVRFRNDTYKQAALYGFNRGTPEFERFKRQYTTDMFVLALGNVFAYSLFESAMPAPYNWFQDTADWIFGDEKERDRAFYGQWPTAVAPLQMVTPPGLRMVPATFSSIVNNDYSRLTEYYIWTMFPFGRMARDVKGIVENPMRTVEKTTGFPFQAFAREATRHRGIQGEPLGKRETKKLAKEYPWVKRALENPKRTRNNESVRTAVEKHPKHGWIVFPTIRLNNNGQLDTLSLKRAMNVAIQKKDFIKVSSLEEGNRISKGFSARLALNDEEDNKDN